jgi:hypothetical protein
MDALEFTDRLGLVRCALCNEIATKDHKERSPSHHRKLDAYMQYPAAYGRVNLIWNANNYEDGKLTAQHAARMALVQNAERPSTARHKDGPGVEPARKADCPLLERIQQLEGRLQQLERTVEGRLSNIEAALRLNDTDDNCDSRQEGQERPRRAGPYY